jgi:pullulanase/glycogen debranching enzyme
MCWGGRKPDAADWSYESRLLSLHLFEAPLDTPGEQIYIAANAHWEPAECKLPPLAWGEWRRFADTWLAAPADIADACNEARIRQDRYIVNPRSVVILVGKEVHAG